VLTQDYTKKTDTSGWFSGITTISFQPKGIAMERHNEYWKDFAKSGDPMMYLAYKENRSKNEGKNHNANH